MFISLKNPDELSFPFLSLFDQGYKSPHVLLCLGCQGAQDHYNIKTTFILGQKTGLGACLNDRRALIGEVGAVWTWGLGFRTGLDPVTMVMNPCVCVCACTCRVHG